MSMPVGSLAPLLNGIRGSASGKGDCWDNAVVEKLFWLPEVGRSALVEYPVVCPKGNDDEYWQRMVIYVTSMPR